MSPLRPRPGTEATLLCLQSANRVSQESGLAHGKIHIGDIAQASEELRQSMQGAHAVIIATSAVPKLRPTSLVGVSRLAWTHSCCWCYACAPPDGMPKPLKAIGRIGMHGQPEVRLMPVTHSIAYVTHKTHAL